MKTLARGKYLGTEKDSLLYKNIILSKTEYCQEEDQDWHCHENSFFAYFLKGGNKELRKSGEINCSAGSLLFYKTGEPHCNKDYRPGSRIFHIEIEKTWFADYNLNPEKIDAGNISHPAAKNIFLNIVKEFSIRDELSESSLQSLMLYLFNLITRFAYSQKNKPAWICDFDKAARQQIDAGLTLKSVARQLNIHPVTLSREFPKHFNCTFGDYVRQLRVEKTLPMLAKKNLPVADIAYLAGFSDAGNFSRCFKRIKGLTPGAYRRLL